MNLNLTAAVSLIDKGVRAVEVTYENRDGAEGYTYKTLDASLKVDDFVVIPTNSRHKMTVAKVVSVEATLDLESSTDYKWIIDKVDVAAYENTIAQEKIIVDKVKEARDLQKREELRTALKFMDNEVLKGLTLLPGSGAQ